MPLKVHEIVIGAGLATAFWALIALAYGDHTSVSSADAGQVQAVAAKQMIWLTVVQIVVAVSGLFGLLFTLRYTRQTADAGIAAATAANRSTKLAEKTFSDLERPYIFIFGARSIKFDYSHDEPFEWIPYEVANYGKVPAIIEAPAEIVTIGAWPEAPLMMDQSNPLRSLPVLAPNERRPKLSVAIPNGDFIVLEKDYYANEYARPRPNLDGEFLVQIRIRYRGPFTNGHETSICWRWDTSASTFVQYGGADLNFEK